jgi:hypothetical protein
VQLGKRYLDCPKNLSSTECMESFLILSANATCVRSARSSSSSLIVVGWLRRVSAAVLRGMGTGKSGKVSELEGLAESRGAEELRAVAPPGGGL